MIIRIHGPLGPIHSDHHCNFAKQFKRCHLRTTITLTYLLCTLDASWIENHLGAPYGPLKQWFT